MNRDEVDFSKLSNEQIADLLLIADGQVSAELWEEVLSRPVIVNMLANDNPPPPQAEHVPFIFFFWPFSLLWKHRPR